MRFRSTIVGLVIVSLLVAGSASSVALAQEGESDTAADQEPIVLGSPEITIEDTELVLSDFHIPAPGDGERTIDERTYTVDRAVLDIDGVSLTVDGQEYRFCQVTVVVEDAKLTVRDVTIGT